MHSNAFLDRFTLAPTPRQPVTAVCLLLAIVPTQTFHRQCDHRHEDPCEQCENLNSTLAAISEAVTRAPFHTDDDRDEAVYLTNHATLAIQSWKSHLLRSAHQDQARLDAIDALDQETIFIVNDWAMKFLPQRYRESQADWFGKRGISWHISVIYRRVEGVLQWQGFIHIIQSCSQGSSAVIAIMHHVLTTLKQEHPEINTAFFRQDNAGCYHCSHTILACSNMGTSCGIRVARIDLAIHKAVKVRQIDWLRHANFISEHT